MLYGIISDIHGNLEALEKILAQLTMVDKKICLGDVVGYGPNPNECVNLIRKLKIPAVAGNHDKAVTGELELTWFNRHASDAVLWTKKEISAENLEFLMKLPLILEEDDFYLVHGSLRSPLEEYITSVFDALPTFEKMKKPLCFVGHFHVPLVVVMKKDGNYDGRVLTDKEEVLVDNYKKVIINVGGVGQPRDGDARACFGIYDTKTRIFTLKRIEYDFTKVQAKMREVGLPLPLIERLQYGR